ncbi:unnamed protein product [Phytophthora lilii]|uniref:Unnamed protein product n=1 Tax=Phytophthora lilii TaxID=2077276 RepID=A0A9W7CQQ2_9STRA|nr:unnamed protein product [Phytophthora lilii]
MAFSSFLKFFALFALLALDVNAANSEPSHLLRSEPMNDKLVQPVARHLSGGISNVKIALENLKNQPVLDKTIGLFKQVVHAKKLKEKAKAAAEKVKEKAKEVVKGD